MRIITLILLLAFWSCLGMGQHFYSFSEASNLGDNSRYKELSAKKSVVLEELYWLISEEDELKISSNLRYYLNLVLQKLEDEAQTDNAEIILKLLEPHHLNHPHLFSKLDVLVEINRKLSSLKEFYQKNLFENGGSGSEIQEELKYYDIKAGEVILEIGAGDPAFAASVASNYALVTVYVNDLDTAALEKIAFQLKYNRTFKTSRGQFFTIQGTPVSTGLENKIVDKIIIRNAFHHFSDPESMLTSIKKSMGTHTQLFIKEKFLEECDQNCCPEILPKDEVLKWIQLTGLKLMDQKRLSLPETNWHLFQLKKNGER